MLAVKSPTHHRRLFKSLPIRHTVYSHGNILLSTTEILKSQKTVLKMFVQFNKLFISESLHLTPFTGFSKGSLMPQQNSEYRSNDP